MDQNRRMHFVDFSALEPVALKAPESQNTDEGMELSFDDLFDYDSLKEF